MGNQPSIKSIVNPSIVKHSLEKEVPILTINQQRTEVHQIICSSAEHLDIILHKIRIKKTYDCPHLIKIIDSHTIKSQSLCSSIIKTFIVIEKPKTLLEVIDQKLDIKGSFSEKQLIAIMDGCFKGISFLLQNNIKINRLTINKIFIAPDGCVKIMDPQFTENVEDSAQISENDLVRSLNSIIKSLIKIGQLQNKSYSYRFHQIMDKIDQDSVSLQILQELLVDNKQSFKQRDSKRPISKDQIKTCQTRRYESSASSQTNSNSIRVSHRTQHFLKPTGLKLNQSYANRNLNKLRYNKQNLSKQSSGVIDEKEIIQTQRKKSETNIQEEINHYFPKKANLRHRRGHQTSNISDRQKLIEEGEQWDRVSMITYQIDKETSVSEVAKTQPAYFLDFINQNSQIDDN